MAENFAQKIVVLQENLCELRNIFNWTAQDFANRLGVTKQTVSNLEIQKVKMSRVQYIAIRAVLECEAPDSQNARTLARVMPLVLDNTQAYLDNKETVQPVIQAIASIARSGISSTQLYTSSLALLATIPYLPTLQTPGFNRKTSLAWLHQLLETEAQNKEIATNSLSKEKNR